LRDVSKSLVPESEFKIIIFQAAVISNRMKPNCGFSEQFVS